MDGKIPVRTGFIRNCYQDILDLSDFHLNLIDVHSIHLKLENV